MCVTGGFVFSRDFSYHIPNLFNRCFMIDFRNISSPLLTLRKLIVLQALALNTLMSLKLLVFGDLLNLDRACLRCLIASLQSSLYHGLLLVGFVEV